LEIAKNDKFVRLIQKILNSKIIFLITISVFAATIIVLAEITLGIFGFEKIFEDKKNNELIDISKEYSIFQIIIHKDNLFYTPEKGLIVNNPEIRFYPELEKEYDKVRYSKEQNVVVVYPIFTEAAYKEKGFYDYFSKKCDETCLTVSIEYGFNGGYGASNVGYNVLKLLGYPIITDVDIDKEPEILKNYDKVILLHNEYITQKEFDAITSHPNVIYLYPNALYAEINVNYETDEITLVRGHNYPTSDIVNGFDWEYDNTHPYEYDIDCSDWEFYEIPNGKMLNCYPENFITEDWEFLEAIKII